MEVSRSHAPVHGAIGGLAAGLVVVLWFFALDVIAGQPFQTPARLADAVIDVLPPVHVVLANLLGGVAMMTYLHFATRTTAPMGFGVLREHPLVTRGFVTGLVGAGAVAVWFLVLDVARGQPFYTPAALGAALLLGATSPAEVAVTLPLVAAYTVLHVAAFAAIGVGVEWAAERIERAPAVLRAGVLTFVLVEGLFVG